jgi:hypothetical protein
LVISQWLLADWLLAAGFSFLISYFLFLPFKHSRIHARLTDAFGQAL